MNVRRNFVFLACVVGLSMVGTSFLWMQSKQNCNNSQESPTEQKMDGIEENFSDDTESVVVPPQDVTIPDNSTRSFESKNDLERAFDHVHTILLFIGYSRSRHSLVSSLLDAHPHVIIADESAALRRWTNSYKKGTTRNEFFKSLVQSSIRASKFGRRSHELEGTAENPERFGYQIQEQWQGQYDSYIEVIGDKTAWDASQMMYTDGALGVRSMMERLGVKVKLLHVLRNPFDNIATLVLRHRDIDARKENHEIKINASYILDDKIERFFYWAEGAHIGVEAFPDDTLHVFSMDVVKKPAESIRKLCDFLKIYCSEKYIQDSAAIVDPVPSLTRHHIVWTDKQKHLVYEKMKRYPFFDQYTFEKE